MYVASSRGFASRTVHALGSYDDPFADDFASDLEDDAGDVSEDDARQAYVNWATAVKNAGGVVAASPQKTSLIDRGMPAARYPVAIIAPASNGYNLNPIFHAWPELWTNSGAYGWYRAPAIVLRYFNAQPFDFWDVGTWFPSLAAAVEPPPGLQAQAVPGEPPPAKPDWYNEAMSILKTGGWIIAGVGGLVLLSYLPRPRR